MNNTKRFFLAFWCIAMIGGLALASPWERKGASGLSSAAAAGSYLKLDASNDPLTGDSLTIDPPSALARFGVDLSPAVDSLQIGDIDGNPSIYFASGKTHIRSVGSFVPSSSNLYDLGDSVSRPWRDIYASGDLTLSPGAGNTSYIQNTGGTAENIMIRVTGTSTQLILDAVHSVQLSNAGATRLRIDGYGNHIYGNIHPEVDKLYDLGSATTAMRTAYVETLLGPASTNLTVDTVGAGTKVGTYANGTLATLISETAITTALNTQSLTTGTSMQVGYDTGAGGCSAPVTCGVATVGTLFYCRDTGASKAGAYCGCMQDASDAYVWSELTTTIASGAVCP